MKLKILIIPLFLFVILFCFQTVYAVDLNTVEKEITTDLGEESAKQLFTELKEFSELTIAKLEEICNKYGISLSEEQKQIIVDNFEKLKKDDSGIIDSFVSLCKKFWDWLISLGKDSEVDIKTDIKNPEPGITNDGDTITVTIPTVEQIDNIVNSIILKIKSYIYPEETN